MFKPSTRRVPFPARWIFAVVAVAAVGLVVTGRAEFKHRAANTTKPSSIAEASTNVSAPAANARVNTSYAALPLAFEANQGQADSQVQYMARGNGYKLYLTRSEAVMTLRKGRLDSEVTRMMQHKRLGVTGTLRMIEQQRNSVKVQNPAVVTVRMKMLGASPQMQLKADDRQPGTVNYFLGKDRSKWHSGVPLYGHVNYQKVYPGVDLSFHGADQQLEFDYIVAPGANTKEIALGFEGANKIETTASGDLTLTTSAGPLQLHKPVAYQENSISRQIVDARFVVNGDRVEFALGPYDHSRELVIDPTVTYSTYFGGDFADYGISIAVDASGNAFVAGGTDSDSIPGPSGPVGPPVGGSDVFVTKISAAGVLQFTTMIGGSNDDFPGGIAVDSNGIYVAGTTDSSDFPTTEGPAFQGGTDAHGHNDAFAMRLGLDGSKVWATYIGGTDSDSGLGVAVDANHNVYVVGETFSTDLPVTNALPKGGSINLGKNTGVDDGYIVALKPDGSAYSLVSYIGGSNGDLASAIALDGSGNAYVAGITNSTDLPTTAGVVQGTLNADNIPPAFGFSGSRALALLLPLPGLALIGAGLSSASSQRKKLMGILFLCIALASLILMPACASPAKNGGGGGGGGGGNSSDDIFVVAIKSNALLGGGSANGYIYETYYGGTGGDQALAIAADKTTGNTFITGSTASTDFPHSSTTFQSTLKGSQNAFLVELNPTASSAVYSTYLGGSGFDIGLGIAVDSNVAYITGQTTSSDFPTSGATQATFGGSTDAFVSALPSGGTSLSFSTYLGGSGDEDQLSGSVAIDASGKIYVTGDTDSGNGSTTPFPTHNPLDPIWLGSGKQCQDSNGNAAACPDGFVTAYTALP